MNHRPEPLNFQRKENNMINTICISTSSIWLFVHPSIHPPTLSVEWCLADANSVFSRWVTRVFSLLYTWLYCLNIFIKHKYHIYNRNKAIFLKENFLLRCDHFLKDRYYESHNYTYRKFPTRNDMRALTEAVVFRNLIHSEHSANTVNTL